MSYLYWLQFLLQKKEKLHAWQHAALTGVGQTMPYVGPSEEGENLCHYELWLNFFQDSDIAFLLFILCLFNIVYIKSEIL